MTLPEIELKTSMSPNECTSFRKLRSNPIDCAFYFNQLMVKQDSSPMSTMTTNPITYMAELHYLRLLSSLCDRNYLQLRKIIKHIVNYHYGGCADCWLLIRDSMICMLNFYQFTIMHNNLPLSSVSNCLASYLTRLNCTDYGFSLTIRSI